MRFSLLLILGEEDHIEQLLSHLLILEDGGALLHLCQHFDELFIFGGGLLGHKNPTWVGGLGGLPFATRESVEDGVGRSVINDNDGISTTSSSTIVEASSEQGARASSWDTVAHVIMGGFVQGSFTTTFLNFPATVSSC